MSTSLLVTGLVQRLMSAGYENLTTPFKVASVEFEFTAALRGRGGRSLDLILIVDTVTGEGGDREGARVRERIEALSRALDITSSRYVLTAILVGGALAGDVEALSSTCRVLRVEDVALDVDGVPAGDEAAEMLDDQIRLLLPLDLQIGDDPQGSPRGDTMSELFSALPQGLDEALVNGLVDASTNGPAGVTSALGERLSEVLTLDLSA